MKSIVRIIHVTQAQVVLTMALLFSVGACTQNQEDKSQDLFSGLWTAQWDTDPAAFPEVSDASIYTMNGSFNFVDKEVTVTAFGFPGCIFSTDTLSHSLSWILQNDTLSLINEGDIYGMTYRVLEMKDEQIRLQLMDDIIVTLTK